MESFNKLTGIAVPLDRVNIDTDAIIPKQFLKRIERTGFGQYLFFDWRFLEDGKTPNAEFILNQPQYLGAQILIAGKNFGCGSSREHAPWSLEDYGFRSIIAPSYADIFYNNCFKNGMLPIVLDESVVNDLLDRAKATGYSMTIDLDQQRISDSTGWSSNFDVDPFRKYCLINGLDDIGLTLKHEPDISKFESGRPSWMRGAAA